jgi:hypothetical protein
MVLVAYLLMWLDVIYERLMFSLADILVLATKDR